MANTNPSNKNAKKKIYFNYIFNIDILTNYHI